MENDALFSSTNSQLELFQVNLADRSMAMTPMGSIKTDYRFVISFQCFSRSLTKNL